MSSDCLERGSVGVRASTRGGAVQRGAARRCGSGGTACEWECTCVVSEQRTPLTVAPARTSIDQNNPTANSLNRPKVWRGGVHTVLKTSTESDGNDAILSFELFCNVCTPPLRESGRKKRRSRQAILNRVRSDFETPCR